MEPEEDTQEAFRFAVVYEEEISQHQTFESGRRQIKSEPVYAVSERKNLRARCGLEFSNVENVPQLVILLGCINPQKWKHQVKRQFRGKS